MAKPIPDMKETIEKKGETVPRYKTLSNGAIYDLKAGKICANPGGGTTAITQAISSEYRARNHAKKTAAAARGVAVAIANGRGVDGVPGDDDAWQMAAEQVAAALFSPKFRDRTDALRVLGPIVDAVHDKSVQVQQQQSQPAQQTNVIAVFLQQLAHKESEVDVIDAE